MPKFVKKCILCKMTLDDPVKLGEFKTYKSISAHYYCLLLTTQLLQNGNDNQGILGFLPQDIRKEEQRISAQICCYCSKPSANLACCATKCRRVFHLYCGLENSAICHFKDDFRTICARHHSAERKKCTKNDECVICCESMGQYHRAFSILAPCCRSGWFHKWCIAKFALNAGYFFKCPLCNNRDVFRSKLVHKGIFVPDQDATWELEPNAFAELLVRPDTCSAEICKCPRGRTYKNYPYKLNMCNTCGSNAIHQHCMDIPSENFNCDGCTGILTNSMAEAQANDERTAANEEKDDEEDKNKNESEGDDDDDEDDVDVDVMTIDTTGKWENYEADDNDSVDSLLLAFSRRKEGSENTSGGSGDPSDISGDSVLFNDKESNQGNYEMNQPEDISDEDIHNIYRSVRKRKPDLQRMDSDDLPRSAKRLKSSSSSLDSVFFDEPNRSFAESDEQIGLRMTDSSTSSIQEVIPIVPKENQRNPMTNEVVGKVNIADELVQTKSPKLKKMRSCESYTSEAFAGFEPMTTVIVSDDSDSIENDAPPTISPTKVKTPSKISPPKTIRQRRMSEFMKRIPVVVDEDESELTDNLTTVKSESNVTYDEDSDVPLAELASSKKRISSSDNSSSVKSPRQSRNRTRSQSTCIDRPRGPKNRRRSLGCRRSKSMNLSASANVRRSSRLLDKPVEKIYKEDLIYVTDLKGDHVKRKAFKETEILHLFVKRDIKLRHEYNGALKENFTSKLGKRPRDFITDCNQDFTSASNKNDIIIRRKSENSGVILFSQPSAFHHPVMKRRTINNFDSGKLKQTFFEF